MSSSKSEIHAFPSHLEFSLYSGDEIRKLSVANIITGQSFDQLGHPLPGGLFDAAMGNYGDRCRDPCKTCLTIANCPGHMGHIELSALTYNPFFMRLALDILKNSCLLCHKLQIKGKFNRKINITDLHFIIFRWYS